MIRVPTLGLAAAGAFVFVAGRGEERGRACVDRIADVGGSAGFLPVDATDRGDTVVFSILPHEWPAVKSHLDFQLAR